MEPSKICDHCGAKMVEYRHTMSVPLLMGLRALSQAGRAINLRDLHLTRNQWDNFQKLRYWGLVRKTYLEGARQAGVWEITELGSTFLAGSVRVPLTVWTYRGETTHDSSPRTISVNEVKGWYECSSDYAASAEEVAA